MNTLSKHHLRLIVAFLCVLAAVRVFVFCAAFPFFNNVDEQAHADLVIKAAHHSPPRGIENFSSEAARYFAIYRSPEYFVSPEQYGGQYPAPNWELPAEEQQSIANQEILSWESRTNYESGEPFGYYATAGSWLNFGHALGLRELNLLYWVRFLNVVFAAVLVWIGYQVAQIVFEGRPFPTIATATLLAIWPQTSFYSIQGDSLSPVIFGIGLVALGRVFESQRPNVWLGIWLGLTGAATCLTKTANLPLLVILAVAMIFKAIELSRHGELSRGLLLVAAFAIAAALPLMPWFAWNEQHFGDLTATKSKIELLGWTPKAFADWWSHPIFTFTGAKNFWAELVASFWRGEFIWHGARMATWWSDAFYWTASTIALLVAFVSLLARRKSEPKRAILWFALLSFAALVGFLVFLSIRFDFGDCPYPSREHPFFTSGRLLNAAAVPFFLLFAYAMERLAHWTRRSWVQWTALSVFAILTLGWQLSINAPALASRYNFFHRQTGR